MNRKPYVKPLKALYQGLIQKPKEILQKNPRERRHTPALEFRKLIIPRFKFNNHHITEETTEALLSALRELYSQHLNLAESNKPVITVVFTTGLTQSGQPNDVPLFLGPVYRIFLQLPLDDKRRMEDLVSANLDLFRNDHRSFNSALRPTIPRRPPGPQCNYNAKKPYTSTNLKAMKHSFPNPIGSQRTLHHALRASEYTSTAQAN